MPKHLINIPVVEALPAVEDYIEGYPVIFEGALYAVLEGGGGPEWAVVGEAAAGASYAVGSTQPDPADYQTWLDTTDPAQPMWRHWDGEGWVDVGAAPSGEGGEGDGGPEYLVLEHQKEVPELPPGEPPIPFYRDFGDDVVDQTPEGWSQWWGTATWIAREWSNPGTSDRILQGSGGTNHRSLRWEEPGDDVGNLDITVMLTATNTTGDQAGLFLRGGPAGAWNAARGYLVNLNGGTNVRLQTITDGAYSVLGQAPYTHNFEWDMIRVRMIGNRLRVKAWKQANPEPEEWMIDVTDDTYSEGTLGAWYRSGSSTNRYPQFDLEVNPEPLEDEDSPGGGILFVQNGALYYYGGETTTLIAEA